jgi:cytochrome c nitrite reductase small subunit
VPHENVARKYAFKGLDGMKHTGAFLTFSEPQVPAAKDPSAQVVMNNCIRCHTELTTEMVKLGKMDFKMTQDGEGKACWDCHRDVPHGGKNSLSATADAKVPFPDSPVPEWLQKAIGHHSPHGHLHGK